MARLEIRLLGELQVVREGSAAPLPASKKTRALLGYLIATGRTHLRQRLCDLLWEGPSDPRAELRWSLAKLRPLVNADGAVRLHADREHIAFDPRDVEIDLARARELLAAGPAETSLDALRDAVRLLNGEFLDGLELPACPRYYEWCVSEREAVSVLRVSALQELVIRFAETDDEALSYARMWVEADPLSESGHAAVVRLLSARGRSRDALAHYEYSRRLLERELSAPLDGELEAARRGLRRDVHAPGGPSRAVPPGPTRESPRTAPRRIASPLPLVGRRAERTYLDEHIARAVAGSASQITLLVGEAGIGKSRLVHYAREQVAAAGGIALGARAFEAEVARHYGVWVDALRGIGPDDFPASLSQGLGVLLPELGSGGSETKDRSRLFDAVVQLLRHVASRRRVVALLLDDLQWVDDASCALLHYVARAFCGGGNLAIVCAARSAELEDSAPPRNLFQSLRGEGQLLEIQLGPLSTAETAELVKAVAPTVDGAAIFSESDGNPFFAIELARARVRGIDWTECSLGGLIGAQLARLDGRARDVLTYAAAFGRAFTPELLAQASGFDPPALLGALGKLEQCGLIRAVDEERYDFAHDLVRQVANRGVSQPRRRLLHAQIARSLALAAESDGSLYAELARHASAAGEHELAARACAEAGERCLRAFANVEATTLAEMGLRHLHHLPRTRKCLRLHLTLLEVTLIARSGPGGRRPPEIADELARTIAELERAGLHAEAAKGHHLLAVWYEGIGEVALAQESSLRSVNAGRAADEATRTRHLARTARCLLQLEREVDRARTLLREAAAESISPEVHEFVLGEGLLQRWDGDTESAAQSLARGLAMARRAQDRWSEHRCLVYLMIIEFERGNREGVIEHAATLLAIGAEMGEADVPFARVLRALVKFPDGPEVANKQLAEALTALRDVSDKSVLAYALNQAAIQLLECGQPRGAQELSSEALATAEAMHRVNEALIARAILARCALDSEGRSAAVEEIERLCVALAGPVSARARAAVTQAAQAVGIAVPTPAPTVSDVT